MNDSYLIIHADHDGAAVTLQFGQRRTTRLAKHLQRGGLLQVVAGIFPRGRRPKLNGIILAKGELTFSATRSLMATGNALAFAERCPITLLENFERDDVEAIFRLGLKALHRNAAPWVVPRYDALPNITQPSRGEKFHENAGGIIYDAKKQAMLFVQRKDNARIGTPKGHREAGETFVRTAIREIREETGVTNISYLAHLPGVTYLSNDHGKLKKRIPHHLHHFLFLRKGSTEVPRVMTGEVKNLRLLWVPLSVEKPPKGFHKDLHAVFQKAREILIARGYLGARQPKRRVPQGRPHER